jgi:hypothetical protein
LFYITSADFYYCFLFLSRQPIHYCLLQVYL